MTNQAKLQCSGWIGKTNDFPVFQDEWLGWGWFGYLIFIHDGVSTEALRNPETVLLGNSRVHVPEFAWPELTVRNCRRHSTTVLF
jgi:hypothetical protein